MAHTLTVESLGVRIGGREIVRQVDLHMAGPGWFGIMGANGGGKTTLLRSLAGRLPISAGRVSISGEEVTASPARRAELTGDAAPLETLPSSLTAAELIELVARSRGVRSSGGFLREELDIDRLRDKVVGAMSSGMRQRVAIHLAFVGDPDLVLLDEPFNWLDPVAAYDVKQRLNDYARSRPLITALHDITTFATRCTAGLLLRDGTIARSFTADDLKQGATDIGGFERDLYAALKRNT